MTARTLKIEDIEYVTYYDYNSYTNYNTRPTEITRAQLKYPKTWGEMGDGVVLEHRSMQEKELTGAQTTITPVSPLINYWSYTFNRSGDGLANPDFYKLLVRPAEEANDNSNYWLSSRSTEKESNTKWHFGLQKIESQTLTSGRLYTSTVAATPTGTESTINNAGIRPVVIIPKSSCIISNGGDNGETYHIQPRG